jgi:hypothetical protein
VISSLLDAGLPVPAVYELLNVNGSLAIHMQRIEGVSMMTEISRNLLCTRMKARELARLHL